MASHVVVIDTSFRRQTVKVTPGSYMADVLDEACKHFGIRSKNYGIKHNNKPVDLSRTFRQTGLTSGAKLELVVASRSPSVVSVALQLPGALASAVPGGRLTDKFPSDTTLWLILRKFESSEGKNLNFTGRGVASVGNGSTGAGRICYEMPTVNVMGRELSTFGDLQKTLAQLGLNSGSGLIRLGFKKTMQPLEQAMAEIEQYFKEAAVAEQAPNSQPAQVLETTTDSIAKIHSTESVPNGDLGMAGVETLQDTPQAPSPYQELAELAPRDSTVVASPKEEEILGPNQRPISVYSAPSSDTPKAALNPYVEEDYEPTIVHAKLHQARLQNNSHNKRLLSDAETERLEREKAERLAAAKTVSIKIRFPDQSTIVSPFKSQESGADLYRYVTSVIVAEAQPFKLVWTNKGPQTVPRDEKKKLAKDLGFNERMLVNFVWEDGVSNSAKKGPILKPQFAQNAKEIPVPQVAVSKEYSGPSTVDKGKETGSGSGSLIPKGMPKWFKGLGKK
ncbi:Uncharacterized protein BP5553_06184 [Venustampulla echinocandica]|uniref:UBX domain-containing protein n=1 Tax=Venustampulla echinocandica TaxID=2656787 RepID=A0A370TMT0_9HELO|nr:Uncharacterized protein BP5553_06184 [Venustampulla echinocandica]RDL36832.1 Uncharacterized protein BP5553_06184 [Venustampulla echinocandica]